MSLNISDLYFAAPFCCVLKQSMLKELVYTGDLFWSKLGSEFKALELLWGSSSSELPHLDKA